MHHTTLAIRRLAVRAILVLPFLMWLSANVARAELGIVGVVVTFAPVSISKEPRLRSGAVEIENSNTTETISVLSTALSCTAVQRDRLSPDFSIEGPWLFMLLTDEDPATLLEDIRAESDVAWAELAANSGVASEVVTAQFPDASRNLFCPSQPQLHRRVQGESESLNSNCEQVDSGTDHDMDMPQAWGISEGDSNVVVAVIDVGFDLIHPGLGGPGPNAAVEDSLLYYNQGVWWRNWREVPGESFPDSLHLPGIAGFDDDNDGFNDEDCWGRLRSDQPESDVYTGTWSSIGARTVVDTTANWQFGELIGRKLCLTSPPLFGSNIAETIIYNDQTSITTADSTYLGPLGTGWDTIAALTHWTGYKVGNLVDSDLDGNLDDIGYIGCPDDDDENGYEDDFRGWDFVNWPYDSSWKCANEDYVGEDNNPTGLCDHGTSVASMIASAPTTGRMLGVAPRVKVMPLRVGWTQRCDGRDEDGYDNAAAIRAFKYAMDAHVDVISISLGEDFPFDWTLVQAAIDSGIIVVRAAGNDVGAPPGIDRSPQGIVWVGGLAPSDLRWAGWEGESNYGSWVDVSARAQGLAVAVWGVDRRPVPGHPELPWTSWMPPSEWHGYAYYPLDELHYAGGQNGTSLAAPTVAGVMALVKSAYPNWTAQEVVNKVLGSTDNIYGVGLIDSVATPMGSGRVNAYKALTFYGNVASTGNATWANEIWVGGDVLVPAGRTLTLAPGTIVNVAIDDLLSTGASATDIEFVINGVLEIQGGAAPVIFRLHEEGGQVATYSVDTTIEGSTFTMATLPAQCAPEARYPIIAASADTTTVLAVEVMSGADLDSVKVDLAGLNSSGVVSLRDDGEGEDSAAGDGVYTSNRFQANVGEGARDVDVLTWVTGGAAARQNVALAAVASKAKFIDVSANTGDLFEGAPTDSTSAPYAAVYFNTAPSDSVNGVDALIVTIDDQSTQPLIMARSAGTINGAPHYVNNGDWVAGGLPPGSRGVSFADFDNDGDNDLFVCGADSSVLYENRLNETEDGFVDITAAYFGAHKGDLTGGVAASWGDYNRDGFLDLFVATTNYGGPMRNLGSPSGHQYATKVFRNRGGQSFEETSFGGSGSSNVCLSGCWVDLNHDGDVELVTVQMGGEYPTVLDNTGFSYSEGDAQLEAGNWDTTGEANGANSLTVIDYDHNPYPDLLVTEVASPGRAIILHNNYDGTPESKSFTPIVLASGRAWNGAVVADYDLNGQEDYLLLPKTGEAALYMANGYSTTTPEYADLGYAVGLRAGVTSGAIAADFNGDHDPDLYLGRIQGHQFQYKNVRQNTEGNDVPDSEQKWLEVRLGTTGSSNSGLIDTEVTVEAGSSHWTQFVDGGSGRGGQRPGRLLFGLGNISQTQATVTVRFPSGAVVDTTVSVNQSYLLTENTSVVLKAGTKQDAEPDFEFELAPGWVNWIFKWRSTNVKGDLRQDVVHIQNYHGYPLESACSIGIEPNATIDLAWGDPGVSHRVYWDGSLWQHEVRWVVPCYPGCEHRFWVTSSSGNGNPATSGMCITTPTSLCLDDMEE